MMQANGPGHRPSVKFTLEVGVNVNHEVFIRFSQPLDTLGMSPDEAQELGLGLIVKAAQARATADLEKRRQR